jgi:hypothetical protein
MTKLGYRESEPNGVPQESSAVLPELLLYLQRKGLTRKSIAASLAISQADLEELLFGLAITGLLGGRKGESTASPSTPLKRVK